MGEPVAERPRSEQRVPALDGLRGLAIALVMLGHFTSGDLRGPAGHLAVFALSGWIGVDLFFVLSGFLITGILLDSRGRANYYGAFYARRFLRIFPAYYAVLGGFLVASAFFVDPEGRRVLLRAAPWLFTYTSNFLMALRGWDAAPLGTSVFWSLAVEEQFYCVWPLVVFWLGPERLPRLCLVLCVLGPALRLMLWLAGADAAAGFTLMPARMDGLAIGAFLAVAYRSPGRFAWVWTHARVAAMFCALVLVGLMLGMRTQLRQESFPVHLAGFSALAAGFGALLTMTLRPGTTKRLMETPSLRFLGRYSYAMYLLHLPAAGMVASLGLRPNNPTLQLAFYVVAGAATSLAALLSWHLWEKQFLRLKRFVPYGAAFEVPATEEAALGPSAASERSVGPAAAP